MKRTDLPTDTPKQAIRAAVASVNGQAALARHVAELSGTRVRQGHVWAWLNRGSKISGEIASYIEMATRLHGTQVVKRERLRPDFPWSVSSKDRAAPAART